MADERSFSNLGAIRTDLESAALDRLLDAQALIRAQRHASAITEGLYALEITLKVLICERLDLERLPKAFQVHDFAGLLVLSGLSRKIEGNVKANWEFVTLNKDWHINALRYTSPSDLTPTKVQDFLDRLRNPPDGVIPWLQAQL